MYKGKPIFIPILVILALIAYGGWYLLKDNNAQENSLEASGTIEAVEVSVAPEVSGKVVEVLAGEGDYVAAGDALLRIEDELLKAQRQRAQAGQEAAQAAHQTAQAALSAAQAGRDLAVAQVDAARASLDLADLQYQRALNAARQAELPIRQTAWRLSQPSEFDMPVWYFQKEEKIAAAQARRDEAAAVIKAEQAYLAKVVEQAGGEELISAEKRLAEAQQSFLIAKEVLDRARVASEGAEVEDYAQQLYDAAEADLESAQKAFDRLLSDEERTDILEARARLAVAQAQYDTAQDRLIQLQTGEQALEVQIAKAARDQAEINLAQAQASLKRAEASLAQAEAGVAQAQAAIAQALAELNLMDLQLERYTVYAPMSGVVLVRGVEVGELIQAGAVAFTLGQLENLKITVYLSEDRYGEVRLGDTAQVTVDSFPVKVFSATVTRIADKAEFTPRNVQTKEGRKTTFFAIELAIDNRDGFLKPGMPADVVFP